MFEKKIEENGFNKSDVSKNGQAHKSFIGTYFN